MNAPLRLRLWRTLHPAKHRWVPIKLWWKLAPQYGIWVHTNASLDQSGFQFYNDDGSESTATSVAAEDTNATLEVDTVYHLRFQVDDTASGVENNLDLQLQRNLNGAGWSNVDGASSVVQSAASQLTDNADTTARLLEPFGASFITPNSGQDEVDGVTGQNNDIDFIEGTHDYVEVVYAFQILSTDVADSDTIQFRVVRSGGTVLESYTFTPQATVSEGAAAIEGDGDFNAPASTFTGAGAVTVAGDGDFTASVSTVSGDGDVLIDADGSFTVSAPTISGSGGTSTDINGDGDFNAPAPTVSGSGDVLVDGDGSFTAPVSAVAGSGDVPVSADGTFTATSPTIAGSGDVPATGSGTFTAPTPNLSGDGDVPIEADGSFTVPGPQVSGAGNVGDPQITGDGDFTAPVPTYAGLGVVEINGDGAAIAPAPVVAGAGTVESAAIGGDGAYSAPISVLSGVGGVEVAGTGSFTAPTPTIAGREAATPFAPIVIKTAYTKQAVVSKYERQTVEGKA